ncbi:Crp/Fnr family transcriptional regulator [Deinococcus sp. Arct2-2]|uniref:Crp/Fnr family transcriptional regulator n=1 Tax=Deinococcus sp. Arct2-2 TaxID=2568653 RepID=UPI0010A35B57|nr:Crp/Fnr family transcriptional regulator [Deinococcus sp. Arct2-2]THF68241.1 Crp/Fnr family transcriptional regulator [Deinococcus sp. Arct2-2]
MDILALLRLTPLFTEASAEALGPLVGVARVLDVAAGTVLARQGDAADCLFIVQSGTVHASSFAAGGRELTLFVAGARQVTGGSEVFLNSAPYTATLTTLTPARVLSLPASQVRQTVFASPDLSRALVAHLARREAELTARMQRLVLTELGARLAAYLLEYAHPGAFPLPTNSTLAAELGSVPEVVSRKLGEFYRLGLISLERRTVRVTDAGRLRDIVG